MSQVSLSSSVDPQFSLSSLTQSDFSALLYYCYKGTVSELFTCIDRNIKQGHNIQDLEIPSLSTHIMSSQTPFLCAVLDGLLERGYDPSYKGQPSYDLGTNLFRYTYHKGKVYPSVEKLLQKWPSLSATSAFVDSDPSPYNDRFEELLSDLHSQEKLYHVLCVYTKYMKRFDFFTTIVTSPYLWYEYEVLFLERQFFIPSLSVHDIYPDPDFSLTIYSRVRKSLSSLFSLSLTQQEKIHMLWQCKDLVELIAGYVITRDNEERLELYLQELSKQDR